VYGDSLFIEMLVSTYDGSESNAMLILESDGRIGGDASTLRRMSYGNSSFEASTLGV